MSAPFDPHEPSGSAADHSHNAKPRAAEGRGRAAACAADGGAEAAAVRRRPARLAHRRAHSQCLPHWPLDRRSGHDHALHHVGGDPLGRRVGEAASAYDVQSRHLSAVSVAGPWPRCRRCRADGDRRACRQPARPHACVVGRTDDVADADRAQRLWRDQTDLRKRDRDGCSQPARFPESRPHRISIKRSVVDCVRHRRDGRRNRREQTRRRGRSLERLHADRHRAADGLHLLRAAPRRHLSQDDGRGSGEDRHLGRHRHAERSSEAAQRQSGARR